MISIEQFRAWYQDHYDQIIKDFFKFLSFPSISADEKYGNNCRECAAWLCDYLKEIGFAVQLLETPGLPVVFGSCLKAGRERPTVLIYHHYDVQPVDPLTLWTSPPFDPVIRNNQVYARGALDNKGQCMFSLVALKAIFEMAQALDVNIKLFIEGEEESGGKGTAHAIKQHRALLKADHLLVVDFDIPAPGVPAITLGMRGIITAEVSCSNASIDLHSGMHGGVALNPNRALIHILSQVWDEGGRVAVPHFYDDVAELSQEELSSLDLSFDQAGYEKTFGVKAYCPEEGYSIRESNWLRPTVEINGMWGGYTDVGFKTVIPSQAHAKISCRLVPHQHPEKITEALTQFLKDKAPSGIDLQMKVHHTAPGYRSDLHSSIAKTAALAYEEVFGKPCRYLLSGGSVPIVVQLAEASGGDVALIGMGLADDDIHAPNEHFGLDRLELGYLVLGKILCSLGE